jgi:hypothetical protein
MKKLCVIVALALCCIRADAQNAGWTQSDQNTRFTLSGKVTIGSESLLTKKLIVNAAADGDGVAVVGGQSPGFMLIAAPSIYQDRNWGIFSNYSSHGDLSFLRSVDPTGLPYDGTVTMTLRSDGNVGIGVLLPSVRLEVDGDIKANGVIHAKFQDIAEWVSAIESIEAGTVVVVAARNHVSASTDAYDTRVAGVVSAQPGLILGEAGDSKVLVATTGRVKVKVDASNGPIREGDILVSSRIKGTAMKSEPMILNGRKFHQPGTVVGKALESLEKGSGEILVLLSMQ